MFHFLAMNLESLSSFNKLNIFWCSIAYIIPLQLINLKKSLE